MSESRYGRTTRRFTNHRRALGILAVLLLALALYLFVFIGRRVPIADSPYTLVVQPGVSDESVQLVIAGLANADRYLQRQLGASVERPVEVRVASFSPCSPLTPLLWLSATAQVSGDRLCVNTRSGVWRQALRDEPGLALAVLAHEHFHLWQHERGCLPDPWRKEYDWLIEGSATYVGWETAIAAGALDRARVEALLHEMEGSRQSTGPLQSYERGIGGDDSYVLARGAFMLLAGEDERLPAFERFCAAVATGEPWPAAFEAAFGTPLAAFYQRFEQRRSSP